MMFQFEKWDEGPVPLSLMFKYTSFSTIFSFDFMHMFAIILNNIG